MPLSEWYAQVSSAAYASLQALTSAKHGFIAVANLVNSDSENGAQLALQKDILTLALNLIIT